LLLCDYFDENWEELRGEGEGEGQGRSGIGGKKYQIKIRRAEEW
jgi:hypothetical protein